MTSTRRILTKKHCVIEKVSDALLELDLRGITHPDLCHRSSKIALCNSDESVETLVSLDLTRCEDAHLSAA